MHSEMLKGIGETQDDLGRCARTHGDATGEGEAVGTQEGGKPRRGRVGYTHTRVPAEGETMDKNLGTHVGKTKMVRRRDQTVGERVTRAGDTVIPRNIRIVEILANTGAWERGRQ